MPYAVIYASMFIYVRDLRFLSRLGRSAQFGNALLQATSWLPFFFLHFSSLFRISFVENGFVEV